MALLVVAFQAITNCDLTASFIPSQPASRSRSRDVTVFRNSANDDKEFSSNPSNDMDMKVFQQRKRMFTLHSIQRRWYQPPNPLLEDPIEFVQAILGALQMRNRNGNENSGALSLLRSSTPSWRKILLKSVGAPLDATNDQVAPTLQSALERPKNQFAILTKTIGEEFEIEDDDNLSARIVSIQKCWYFPTDPVVFEGDDDDIEGSDRIIDHCWIESRLRSPTDDQLLAVVGWSLQRRHILQEERHVVDSDPAEANQSTVCWLLDGIDWQDFRDDFRPGIGREEWERICG